MLVKLLPNQVADNWEFISHAIEGALPPFAPEAGDRMSKVLVALMSERMECWCSVNTEGVIDNVVTTTVSMDDCSGMKNLVIYSVYGVGETSMNKRSWLEAYKTLSDYARGRKCNRIVAYTDSPSIIKLVEKLGGEARYTFVSVPITSDPKFIKGD